MNVRNPNNQGLIFSFGCYMWIQISQHKKDEGGIKSYLRKCLKQNIVASAVSSNKSIACSSIRHLWKTSKSCAQTAFVNLRDKAGGWKDKNLCAHTVCFVKKKI